jgi:hypothetical protein
MQQWPKRRGTRWNKGLALRMPRACGLKTTGWNGILEQVAPHKTEATLEMRIPGATRGRSVACIRNTRNVHENLPGIHRAKLNDIYFLALTIFSIKCPHKMSTWYQYVCIWSIHTVVPSAITFITNCDLHSRKHTKWINFHKMQEISSVYQFYTEDCDPCR